MDEMIVGFFQSLFTATDQGEMDDILSGMEGRATEQMNEDLIRPYVTPLSSKCTLQRFLDQMGCLQISFKSIGGNR